jgi:hypothetical protein
LDDFFPPRLSLFPSAYRVLVSGEGGEGIAFSRRGSSVKDMEEYYAWAMDIQVGLAQEGESGTTCLHEKV